MRSLKQISCTRLQKIGCCLGLLLLLVTGCGYPVAEPGNMRLISTLRTALSARNEQWLQANEELVKSRREQGEMRDEEFEAFQSIIQQARDGDWASAEREAVKFQRAQRPTEEQIQRLRKRS